MSLSQDQLGSIRQEAAARVEQAVSLAGELCLIPAPTGSEGPRAAFVARLLEQRGYSATIDDINNVYSCRGDRSGKSLMLLAHTDTVFPADTVLTVIRNGTRAQAPGIGDNCLGVAAMVTAIDILDSLNIETSSDIRVVANVGEEGLGNLRGAWRAHERFGNETGAVIAIEGHNLGRVTHVGVGSRRWKVTVRGPGGHSWGAFGEASAIHGLGRIIASISRVQVPDDPRTTYNVGVMSGGTSINTIASEATALIDMRSVSESELEILGESIGRLVESEAGPGLEVSVETMGERPAGSTAVESPLVKAAIDSLAWLGIDAVYDASSTDANVAISQGIPAVCVGITSGGRVHTTDEYIDIPPIESGISQLVRLCVEASHQVSSSAG